MLNEKQIFEIKEHLEKAQNPLFFFDNDTDGLCSFLLLARAYEKGKGVAIKSFPELDESYARKLHELNPDYVFILDKPLVSRQFIDEALSMNMNIVWIDHHDVEANTEGVNYYNSNKNENKSLEPVTYWAWEISKKKEDLWLAVCGCIGDNFLPEFFNDFCKENEDLCKEAKTAFEVLYESEIGKIARIMSFALKDRTSNVVKMIKYLIKLKNPREILIDDSKNHLLFRFNQVDKKYQKLMEKARNFVRGKLVYFQYGGDLSLSGEISNELLYKFPGKVVVVAYIKGTKVNISIRGKNAKEITLKAIENLEGATGGGHIEATGAKVNLEDLPKFKERIEKLISV